MSRSGVMCGIHVVPLVALSLMAAPAQAQNERATLTVSCPGLPGMFANDTPKGYGALGASRVAGIAVQLAQGKQDYALGISGAHYPLTSGQLTLASGRATLRFSGRYKDGTIVNGSLSQRSTAAGAIYLQGSAEASGPKASTSACQAELISSELRDIAQWVGERPAAVAADAPRAARAAQTAQPAAAPPAAQPQRTVASAPKPVPVAPDASPQQRRAVAIGAAD